MSLWDSQSPSMPLMIEQNSDAESLLICRGPVTSLEWCPFESSVLTTTSADGQLAVWDLALERDPEEEAALAASMNAASPDDLPAQLLFVHLGQVSTMLPSSCWLTHWSLARPIVAASPDGQHVFACSMPRL